LAKINPNISRQSKSQVIDIQSLLKKALDGDRFSLSQAITLIESTRPEDRLLTIEMVEILRTLPGESFRIAVSGSPGSGKSTFIETLGFHSISSGFNPAVLAIDPSSQTTGGSILGDKIGVLIAVSNITVLIFVTASYVAVDIVIISPK